jgi:hypothetical protein
VRCCTCDSSLTISNGLTGGSIPDELGNLWNLQCVYPAAHPPLSVRPCVMIVMALMLAAFFVSLVALVQNAELAVADADGHGAGVAGQPCHSKVR